MTEDLSGLTIKGYELSERIGAGGFGAVYTAEQSTVGRRVAVKIILPGYANRPDFIRRFESEARLIARLEHPYIVPLYDYWRDPSGAYLVMRWLRAGSLRDALGERPFSIPAAAQILDQAASGLSLAHRSGVVHRDIKPSNILLDEEGNAYLSDFGIAQELKRPDNGGRGERLVGTLDYLSPEQAKDEATGPQSDIYSLGITLYELLTGQHPYPGHSSVERLFKHINDPLPEIENLSGGVNEVLRKATAKNPAQRYADALEMASAFRQAARLDGEEDSASIVETLTPREQQILGLIVAGKTNRQIAQELFIEHSTVKWYIRQIYSKLGVRSRVQAMVRARELQLVVPGPEDVQQADKSTSVSIALQEAANPYKGLRAFEAADSRDFFGREALIKCLTDRLDGVEGQAGRFLAIVGPSGSGKSSLVQAGLIPAIWRGALPGSERWFVVEMMPGARPLDELEVALTRVAANQTERLRAQLTRDENGLLRVAGLILPNDGSELVLIIDQFEELFTLVENEEERQFFLNLLHQAVSDPRSRVRVVTTLRADFYHRPLQYPEFGELVRGQMETVLPLSAEELERAIVQPAEGAGAQFEAGLAATIIEDVRYQPGGLPLMQYALTELFDRREGRLLTRGAYEAIGGIAGALAGRAESLYQELDPGGQEMVRQLFLQLTTVEQEADDGFLQPVTRRRVTRSELQAVVSDPEVMDEVIDTYAAYRLLALDHDPSTRRPTVEVAHEAILVSWDRLRSWLEESRDDLRQRRRLGRLAADWQESGRDPSFLLAGTQLDLFVNWAASTDLALTAEEKAFLAATVAAREARLAEEEARQQRELETAQQLAEAEKRRAEEQAQAAERLRNRAYLLAGALLVAAVLAAAALGFARSSSRNADTAATRAAEALANQYLAATNEAQAMANEARAEENAALAATREAEAEANAQLAATRQVLAEQESGQRATAEAQAILEREKAEEQARLARSRELAAAAQANLEVDPERSALLAMEALGITHTLDAEDALHLVVPHLRVLNTFVGHEAALHNIAYNNDGSQLATSSFDGTVRIWDVDKARKLLVLEGHEDFTNGLSFGPQGELLATSGDDGTARIWDTETGEELLLLDGHSKNINLEAPDGPPFVRDVAISPNRQLVATAATDGTAVIWELATGEQLLTISGDGRTAENVDFSPDSTHLAVAGSDGWAHVVDAATGELIFEAVGEEPLGIRDIQFSPDGALLATISEDRTVRLWEAETGEPLASWPTGASSVLDFNDDGSRLIISSLDGTVSIWDVASGQIVMSLAGHQEQVGGVQFSPDGTKAATASFDGTARTWDLSPEHEVLTLLPFGDPLQTDITSIALSPDGQLLAVAGSGGEMSLFDFSSGEEIGAFAGHDDWIGGIAFNPDGSRLVSAADDLAVKVWDVASQQLDFALEKPDDMINDVAFSPDGTRIAGVGVDEQGTIWDSQTGERLFSVPLASGGWAMAFSPDGSQLATGDMFTSVVTLWDMTTGEAELELLNYEESGINPIRIVFTPDGTRLIVSALDGTVKIWDTKTGEALQTIKAHQSVIFGMALGPDGETLATASGDRTARLWNINTGERLLTLSGHSDPLTDVAFTADSSRLLTAGQDGSVRVYELSLEKLMELSQSRITRGFTVEECERFNIALCPWEPVTSK